MDDLQFYILFNSIQLYQDKGCVIMKGYMQWNPVYDLKDSSLKRGSNLESLDQQDCAFLSELLGLYGNNNFPNDWQPYLFGYKMGFSSL